MFSRSSSTTHKSSGDQFVAASAVGVTMNGHVVSNFNQGAFNKSGVSALEQLEKGMQSL